MSDTIFYQKLVRDRIPEIIRNHGKNPRTRILGQAEFKEAVAAKIIEEVHELYREWKQCNSKGILKESADLLEILLAALNEYGFTLDDLLAMRQKRETDRGGFKQKIFLERVGDEHFFSTDIQPHPLLIFNPDQQKRLIDVLRGELAQSESVWIASAFYSPGITNLLMADLENFLKMDGSLRILLSTMGNIVRPEYFTHLKTFLPDSNLKVFHPPEIPFDQDPPSFHAKAFLFRHARGDGSILIGSSNFTEAGFTRNVEWNFFSPGEVNLPFGGISPFESAIEQFERYWNTSSVEISQLFLEGYRKRFQNAEKATSPLPKRASFGYGTSVFEKQNGYGTVTARPVPPNTAQKQVLDTLSKMRKLGISRAAAIAATGIGKTYLAAFDFRESGFHRVLFIAHRENILYSARGSFARVMAIQNFGVIMGGGNTANDSNVSVFAMIQTLSRENHLEMFSPDHFDYIVIDEFHHSEASSYRKVLDYFKPVFLLGLTATPERMDGRDVLALCDYNIACEIRLMEAVNKGWLTPFQYYAIYDQTDYSQIAWRGSRYDEAELEQVLENDTRTEIISRNLLKYLPSSGKIKALAFCSSIAHAIYTARKLNDNHGIESISLTGETPENERQQMISRLRNEKDPLRVICCVDIFNEGIDIPELTHVLFLRPTMSFTVFLQQLGRGLRLFPGKNFLVALDFVGNFKKVHVAPLALSGFSSIEQFMEFRKTANNPNLWERLPNTCFLSADTDVERIWDDEIRRILRSELSVEERLKALYLDIREDLGDTSPTLMDFLSNPRDIDPYIFIRQFGSWLSAKEFCDGFLSEDEKQIVGTAGEKFLAYFEKDLNPVKSYKMVVLISLLNLPGTEWQIEMIAHHFLSYYLNHPDRIADYDDLAKSPNPREFSIRKVVSKLQSMPLHFLSNTANDFFILEKNIGVFRLKPEMHPYWNNDSFRQMVKDRVMFALERYFRNSGRNKKS
jgi:superfamily II DNA or RNA helicase/predicted house-cleaning noncanonical NTP pyrophosphatase (MazG superfamily)/HKD family nuclease